MARVLAVDDDAPALEIRKLLLERSGHEVITAGDATSARARFQETSPDTVLLDLRMPEAEDGLSLIREFRAAAPQVRIVVLAGWSADLDGRSEAGMVDEVLPKPVRSERLLSAITKVLALVILCLQPMRAQQSVSFRIDTPSEVVADLDLSSPGADWSAGGREAALAEITVDGGASRRIQHVMLYAGAARHTYSIFLGMLTAGQHKLGIARQADYSAAGAGLESHGARFRNVARASGEYAVLAHAPVLYARENTVGKFTDVPMIVYAERSNENGAAVLMYTVIFSNEDGGTSTRALMARWGRTTDVEYVYKAYLNQDGSLRRATIQGRGHQEIEFDGRRDGTHPLLIPVTDNNMVSGEATSAIRYQIAPVMVDLAGHSRERVMDDYPFSYRVMAQELAREAKLRPFGTVDGNKISDPRNYLYIEARVKNEDSGVAAVVHLKREDRWRSSYLGREDYAIERSGWVRTAVELPPGTHADEIAEIGFTCIVVRQKEHVPISGTCRVEEVSKAFLLDTEYRARPPLWSATRAVEIPTGETVVAQP